MKGKKKGKYRDIYGVVTVTSNIYVVTNISCAVLETRRILLMKI